MERWLKGFLLFVIIVSMTSWLFIGWAQSQLPQGQTVTLTTEDVSAYRTFQRDCLKKAKLVKTKVKLTITIYYREIRTWRLTCDWEGQS